MTLQLAFFCPTVRKEFFGRDPLRQSGKSYWSTIILMKSDQAITTYLLVFTRIKYTNVSPRLDNFILFIKLVYFQTFSRPHKIEGIFISLESLVNRKVLQALYLVSTFFTFLDSDFNSDVVNLTYFCWVQFCSIVGHFLVALVFSELKLTLICFGFLCYHIVSYVTFLASQKLSKKARLLQ